MFSNTAEYALRAVVYLATVPDRRVSSQAIAQAIKVPAQYIAKVLKDLARAGIVDSQRGPSGGFLLAGDARKLSVLSVADVSFFFAHWTAGC